MKKRLNLLCACVLIGLLLSTSTVISLMVQAVSAGFKAGYESVEKGKEFNISDYKIVCTIPSDLFAETGSVTNLKNSSQASIKPVISLIEAPTTGSSLSRTANGITTLISVLASIFCLIQFFYLIRNINRGDIFSWKNVKFLRKLGVSLILLFICSFTTIMIGNYEAAQVLELKGCEYSNIFAFSEPTFILGFIALLVAEVFAVGLKMKEEQDLTI